MSEPVKKIPCEVYSRCVGYLRPVANWNIGKKAEFKDRKVYELPKEATVDSVQLMSETDSR